jgi:hypothetical protein
MAAPIIVHRHRQHFLLQRRHCCNYPVPKLPSPKPCSSGRAQSCRASSSAAPLTCAALYPRRAARNLTV